MTESLLCLDPSSTACGVAYFPSMEGRNPSPEYINVIKPKESWCAITRIDFIVSGVLEIVARFKPQTVLMEYSNGKVAGRLKHKHPSGLAVMGQAQGEVRRALITFRSFKVYGSELWSYQIETIDESWTKEVSKAKRAMQMRFTVPEYREFTDRCGDDGYDAADACGMGLWYIGQRNQQKAIEAGSKRP